MGSVSVDALIVGTDWTAIVTLSEGENTITATASDGPNISPPATLTITLDTVVPIAPVFTTTDSTTVNTASFDIEGTTEAGTTVSLTVGSASPVFAILSDIDDTWSATVTLSEGPNTITAIASDGPNTSVESSLTATLDTVVPIAPVFTTTDSTTVNTASFDIEGTTEAGTTVSLTVGSVSVDALIVGTDWTATVTLSEGENTITAIASDGLNTSVESSLTVTLDTVVPIAPVFTTTNSTTVNTASFDIEGTTEAGTTVSVTVGSASPVFATLSDIDDTWSATVTLSEGPNTITATASDELHTSVESSLTVTLDTGVPIAPVFTTTNSTTVNTASFDIEGTTEAGTTVSLTVGSVSVDALIVGTDWTATVTLSEGENTITAIASDELHTSVESSLTVTLDTVVPIAPVFTTTDSRTVDTVSFDIEGTTEAGTTVSLTVGSASPVFATLSDIDDTWSATVTLSEGPNTITATASDGLNTSVESSLTVTLDSTPPTVPVITIPAQTTIAEDTITITGTGDAGATITLGVNRIEISTTATVAIDESWSIANVALREGANIINATATDSLDRTSDNSTILTITRDSIPPIAPVFTTTDSTTVNIASFDIEGTTEDGTTVSLTVGSVSVDAIVLGTDWTATVTLSEGPNTITATASDELHTSLESSLTVTLDTVVPIAPVFTTTDSTTVDTVSFDIEGTTEAGTTVSVTVGSVSVDAIVLGTNWTATVTLSEGENTITATASDGPNTSPSATLTVTLDSTPPTVPVITNPSPITIAEDTITVTGTGDVGATITLIVNRTEFQTTATVAIDESWSIVNVALSIEGENVINATATDSLDRTSGLSNNLVITRDSTPPIAPVFTTTDSTVNTASFDIEGTTEAGTTVSVTVGSVSVDAIVTGKDWTATVTLSDGENIITATASDSLGRTSGLSNTLTVTLDTVVPIAPVFTTTDSTIVNTASFDIEGTTEAGTTVSVTVGSVSVDAIVTGKDWTATVTLSDGENTITATASDSLGRTSGLSNTLTVTLDTVVPIAPVFTTTDSTIVNTASFDIEGTTEAGTTVSVTVGSVSVDAIVLGTNWTATVTLSEGENTITATASDGPNTSPSATLTVTLDSTPPTVPVITNPSPITIAEDTITVTGTGDVGATITLIVNRTEFQTTATVAIDESWSIVNVALSIEGENVINATATDSLDRTSGLSNNLVITRDSTPPIAPVFTTTDSTVNTASFDIEGTTEAGTTVSVTVGSASPVSATLSDIDDTWSATVTLSEGPNTITATASDGPNTSIESSLTVTLDTVAPIAPVFTTTNSTTVNTASFDIEGTTEAGTTVSVTGRTVSVDALVMGTDWTATVTLSEGSNNIFAIASDGPNTSGAFNLIVILDTSIATAPVITIPSQTTIAEDTITIIGTGDAGATITLTVGGTVLPTMATVAIDESWSIANVALNEGENIITATAIDSLGRPSGNSNTLTITRDGTPPTAPVITIPSQTTIAEDTITITGTGDAGATITLTVGGTELTTIATVETDGSWTIANVPLNEGLNIITAAASDSLGRTSGNSNTLTITRDSTPPNAPVFTTTDSTVDTVSFDVEGTTEDRTTVSVTVGSASPVSATLSDIDDTWSATVTLSEGENIITATASDELGNESVPSNILIITLDTAPPTISGARTATTSTITITFNENVFGNTSNSDWSVAGNTITSISQTDLSEGTGSLILTVITALDTDATPSVTYTAPPTDPITDNARNSLASATIISTDGISPTFTAITSDSDTITVSFTEPILPPPSSPNTWSVSGTSLTSTNISSLSGDLLHSGLNSGATPTITYLPPFEDPITDLSGNVLDTTPIIAEDGVIPAPSQIFRVSDTMAYIVFQEDIQIMGTAYVQLTLGDIPPPFVPTLTIVSIDGSRILASGIDSTLLSSNMLDVFFNNITDSSGNIRSNMTHNIVQAFPSIPVNNSPAFTTTEFTIPTGVITEHTITAPTDNDELTLTITPTGTDHIIPTKFTITSSDVTLIIPEDTTYTVQNNPSNSNELVIDPTIDRQSVTYIAFDNADANIKNANDAIVALLNDSSHQPLYLVEIGSTTQTATLDKPVSIRLAGASNADYIYYIETSQTSDRTVHSIIQCTDDAITAIVPPTFSGQDECYIIDGADIVIWTNHFTQFGASTMRTAGTSSSSSSSSGCNDCTPPTLGVDNTGTRRVSNGFTYNEQTTNVDYYYTPLPLITVEVGQENVAKLRIYEDSGPTRLRHAGLAFGISTGQHFAQSEVSINVDISFNGELAINLNDPQNIIDNDTLRAERTIVSCMENSESECTLITINHTFRQPLDFNIVSTSVWDERRNSWQNFYNHGIEITGDSLNPTHGILVNDGTLTLYPIIEGTVDKDGDSIYDTRHVIYMLDDGGILYRLGTDGTYQIVRNLYSQLHDVDDSMYNDGRIGSHGVERDQDAFIVELEKQDVIARKILDEMGLIYESETGSIPELYENIRIIPRMEKLHDDIAHQTDIAEQILRELYPSVYKE